MLNDEKLNAAARAFENDNLSESEIGSILRDLKGEGINAEYYFVDRQKLWLAIISIGNDLQYFGSGLTLASALSNALDDVTNTASL